MDGRKLSVDEIKNKALDVVCEIDKICRQQKIEYSLAYGTLLGAVRHKGFIPWDDDIDVMMPRREYDKFISYCKTNNTMFKLEEYSIDDDYVYTFSKACDRGTVVKEKYSNRFHSEYGVFVDIFPIDALGQQYNISKKHFKRMELLRNIVVAGNWKIFFRNSNRGILVEPIRFAFFILSRFVNLKRIIGKIENYYSNIKWDDSVFAGNAVDATWGLRNIITIDVFSSYKDITFENTVLRSIANPEKFLRAIYGDFMTLPPEERRVTHHTFEVYSKKID